MKILQKVYTIATTTIAIFHAGRTRATEPLKRGRRRRLEMRLERFTPIEMRPLNRTANDTCGIITNGQKEREAAIKWLDLPLLVSLLRQT